MEILQVINFIMKIWTALTTENEGLINILFNNFGFPFIFIELTVSMLLFTTILNISATKKQKVLYVIILALISAFSNSLIPKPYATFIHMILAPIAIMFIFKISFFKSIIAEIIPLITTSILETLFLRIYLIIFNIEYENVISIPIYRLTFVCIIYFTMFILYKLTSSFKFNITLLDSMNFKNKRTLIVNFILGLITIGTQFYLGAFYYDNLPLFIVILSIISLIAYFIISIYSLTRTTKLELTTQDLEETKLYNQSLIILHDSVRGFKHDFHNILQAIGGYIDKSDMEGLNKYYSQLVVDCQRVNNLTSLNPETINNPAIYGILASKYLKADELGIQINLEVFLNLNKLNMKIYEFTRILGILMDNAIEASSKCDEKIIRVEIRNDFKVNRQVLIIENTYSNKDVDTEKIFEKGYTSKTDTKNPHGLGLWEVRQILKKNNNLNLFTSKDNKFFKQQLEIY